MRLAILAFVAGVWALQLQPSLPPSWTAFLVFPPLLGAWFLPARQVALRAALLGGALFLLGFCWAGARAHLRLADALPPEWAGRDVTVVGVVEELPRRDARAVRFRFRAERVETAGAAVPRHIELAWYRDDGGAPVVEPQPAERWRLTVRLRPPRGGANPHDFDYEAWLLERGVRATGYVHPGPEDRRLAAWAGGPGDWVERLRADLSRRIATVLEGAPLAGVVSALAVGEQSAISPAQWKVFSRTGVVHLVSISGLHVTMLAALAFGAVQAVWRRVPALAGRVPSRRAATVAGFVVALDYALLAGFSVPTQRTVFMLAVMAAALWSGRFTVPSRVLALALLAVVLLDPWAVLAPGFWLSFGACALIFVVAAGRLEEGHALIQWGRVQWAITLGLAPLLLALFGQFSLISPLANALAIPVVSFLVTPLALLGTFLPMDGALRAAHFILEWGYGGLERLAAMPGAVWVQHAPVPWAVGAALLGVVWLLAPRGVPGRGMGIVLGLPLFLAVPPSPAPGAMTVTALDVGQGLAVVVRTRDHALLFDTGPRYGSGADAGERVVVPYLRGEGIARLDGMVVSHDDSDHSGGASSVLAAVPVGWVLGSLPAPVPLPLGDVPFTPCRAGAAWEWDGVRFEVLNPVAPGPGENDDSCVLRVDSAYGTLLLPADLERDGEAALAARARPASFGTVVIAPHHGSRTSSTPAFLAWAHPAHVVFSAGHGNRFGHPHGEVVARYRAAGARTWRTDRDGALVVQFGREGVRVVPWRAAHPRYWRDVPSDGGDMGAGSRIPLVSGATGLP